MGGLDGVCLSSMMGREPSLLLLVLCAVSVCSLCAADDAEHASESGA